jgi:DNA-binding NtrC family response regulator
MGELQSKRILIVDDDTEIRKTVTAMLESIGFLVMAVAGANAAIALIDRERPDVILTDIHMAEGDGLELINAVRDRGLNIPIVAMSGGGAISGLDNLELARKLGAAAIVDKPFRSSHLAEALDRAINGRGAPPRRG